MRSWPRCARGTSAAPPSMWSPIEPLPPDHPLWEFDNVVMTPHTAGASQLRGPRNIGRFCENLRRAQTGDGLVGIVDKQLGF